MATPEQLAAMIAVVPAAQAAQAKWRVPASITLAQWQLESAWGTSKLSLLAKNYFGIKSPHPLMPDTYVEFPTTEYESGQRVVVEALFERYETEEACFDAHGRLLATAARYRAAMGVTSSPYAFAMQLQEAGYSTSPTYGRQLVAQICDYNLTQYDKAKGATA